MSNQIFLQLEKNEFLPNDQLNGFINLIVTSQINANKISLLITGIEEVKLVESRVMTHSQYQMRWHSHQKGLSRNVLSAHTWDAVQDPWHNAIIQTHSNENTEETRAVILDHYSTNEVIKHEFPAYEIPGGMIYPGQYQIPFSFKLPSGIPASFSYRWTENLRNCFGETSYLVRAYVSQKGFSSFFKSNIISEVPIVVNNPQAENKGVTHKSLEKKVHCCCCVPRGELKLKTYFEKNNYYPGEKAYLISEINAEDMSVSITSLRSYFRQVLKLSTSEYSKTINKKISSTNSGRIEKGTKSVGEHALRQELMLVDTVSKKQVQPSSQGQLIKNSYTLEARSELDTCICGSKPTMSISVNIVSRKPEVPHVDLPNNWKPQVQDTYVASMSNQYNANTMYPSEPINQQQGNGQQNNSSQPGMPVPQKQNLDYPNQNTNYPDMPTE